MIITPPSSLPSIQINTDGTITPIIDAVNPEGNTYYLTRNLTQEYVLEIHRSNIIVDGKNYTIDGGGAASSGISLNSVTNVTIKNVKLINFYYDGVYLQDSSNCLITVISSTNNSYAGIDLRHSSNKNTITQNQIINNDVISGSSGILLGDSRQNNIIGNNVTGVNYIFRVEGNTSSNRIYFNNFVNYADLILGDLFLVNFWDNGKEGNYWSRYNGTDADLDGIGDTPYVIDGNNTDNYPLISQTITSLTLLSPSPIVTSIPIQQSTSSPSVPEFPTWIILSLFLIIATSTALTIKSKNTKKE